MEFMKNDHHRETTSASAVAVAVADHHPKTYTVMTSTGKPLKIRFVFGRSSKNKPAADKVPTQDHDQERVLEADEKMQINKARDIISNRQQQQQQMIQEKNHKKAATTTKDHHQEAAKQVKDHQTTMITVKKSFRRIRTPDDQYCSAPPPSDQIKLEASKRKLHESYEELADAKKQKRIKVIEHLPPKKSASSSPREGAAAAATPGSTSTSKARGAGIKRFLSKKKNLHHGRPRLALPTY